VNYERTKENVALPSIPTEEGNNECTPGELPLGLTNPGHVSSVPPEIRSITLSLNTRTCGKVFLEELTGSQLVKKLPTFYGN
jgi:hypothetical protein